MAEIDFDLLAIRNETFLREILFYEKIDSTNSALLAIASQPVETPLLLLTQRQLTGRGRGGNAWWSNVGSLTFSLLLDFPMLAAEDLSSFSLTVGLAICQSIEKHDALVRGANHDHLAPAADLALKWPNDVYLNGKKLAGILIERPKANEPRLVIGIGINLNNDMTKAPRDVRANATSLLTELGHPLDANRLLIDCLRQIERRSREQIHHPTDLLESWRAYCLLTGRSIEVQSGNAKYVGRCLGIDATGALLVACEAGTERIVTGTVTRF